MTNIPEEDGGWRIVSINDGWRIVSVHNELTPLYEGMHRLICKLAWRYSHRCAMPVEDLISEAYATLLMVQCKYNPARSARSTFVYWVVRNRFCYLAKRWPILWELPQCLATNDMVETLESACGFRHAIGGLSEEAKEVVQLILSSPKEICELVGKMRTGAQITELYDAVMHWLPQQKSWKAPRWKIDMIMQEIKEALKKH